jgi:hypothetical protein
MTFLNSALLWGTLLLAVPILIHLLHRRRVRVVRWGAMHLLDLTVRKSARRVRIEELILLAVRCAIPVLLALALARPVFSGFRALLGHASSATLVLLDNSYSMDAGGPPAHFQQAREFVARKLASLGAGSVAAVIPLAGGLPGAATPTTDLDRLGTTIQQAEAGFGRARVAPSLLDAIEQFGATRSPVRELVVVSDFQRNDWSAPEADARERAFADLNKLSLKPEISLVRLGTPARENLSVGALEFPRLVIGVGQSLQVRANIRNHGERAWNAVPVVFRVDGKERSATQVSLPPGEQKQVIFSHAFDSAGAHLVEISLDGDALTADNASLASVPVWEQVPVLLVNGDPRREALRGETDFLEIALRPFGLGRVPLADLVTTRTVTTAEVTADSLETVRVVVLANVGALSDAQITLLQRFVADGGGLLVFPGDRCSPEQFNRSLLPAGLVPAPITAVTGETGRTTAGARVVAEPFRHAALELFNDSRNGSLGEIEIQRWFRAGAPAASSNTVATLARLDTGDPFLIEQRVGEGRVIFCATACDADWGNFPTRAVYVPLMQRLVTHLASAVYPPRNLAVGEPLLAFFRRIDAGKKATVIDPSGRRAELNIERRGQRAVIEHRDTLRPGVYKLTGPDGVETPYVVNAPREESDLAALADEELDQLAERLGARVDRSWEEHNTRERQRRFGSEVWAPLLWAALALVFLELVLEQWFTRRRA